MMDKYFKATITIENSQLSCLRSFSRFHYACVDIPIVLNNGIEWNFTFESRNKKENIFFSWVCVRHSMWIGSERRGNFEMPWNTPERFIPDGLCRLWSCRKWQFFILIFFLPLRFFLFQIIFCRYEILCSIFFSDFSIFNGFLSGKNRALKSIQIAFKLNLKNFI